MAIGPEMATRFVGGPWPGRGARLWGRMRRLSAARVEALAGLGRSSSYDTRRSLGTATAGHGRARHRGVLSGQTSGERPTALAPPCCSWLQLASKSRPRDTWAGRGLPGDCPGTDPHCRAAMNPALPAPTGLYMVRISRPGKPRRPRECAVDVKRRSTDDPPFRSAQPAPTVISPGL